MRYTVFMAKRFLKFSKYFFLLIFIFVLIALTGYFFWFWRNFSRASQHNYSYFRQLARQTYQVRLPSFNILLLGLDTRSSGKTLLTDTIIVASYLSNQNKIVLLSLPRDLWLFSLKTKINALYFYGQKENQSNGTDLMKKEIRQITGKEIKYSVLFDFNTITEIVDILGGVEIEVMKSFDDDFFPNDDGHGGVVHLHFEKGRQKMDGQRALQYIRSRKSADLSEGTDQARVIRQQKVIMALFEKISSPQFFLLKPEIMGKLLVYWQDNIKTDLSLPILLKMAMGLFSSHQPWFFVDFPPELLVNPSINKYGLWVWEPRSGDWSEIKNWIVQNI